MGYDLQKASVYKRAAAWLFDAILISILAVGIAFLLSALLGFDGYSDTVSAAYAKYEEAYAISFSMDEAAYAAMTADEQQRYADAYAALLADDEAMLAAFESGEDIHTATAATVFGVPVEAVTPELRKRAKAVNFGILYGMGAYSLSEDLHISQAKAKEYIASYFAAYPQIDGYLKSVIKTAYEDGFVTTLLGRRRYIPELKMQNKNMQHFGERVAMNSPIQGTAADIIKIAMVRVDERLKASGLDARLILQVHDELIVECHKRDAAAAKEILVREMESAATLAVDLKVGVEEGASWYDSH